MNNWKIVANIATAFGIVFIVFSIFQAILTYQTLQYSNYPANLVQLSMLTEMLPLLLYGVLSLLFAGVVLRATKHTVVEKEDTLEKEEQEQTDLDTSDINTSS